MRTLSWANAEGEKFGGATFKTLSKDENLSLAIKDVTGENNPKKALDALEAILKETKIQKDMVTINEFSKKIVNITKEVDKKKKKVSKKSETKTRTIKANQELVSVTITKETYDKRHQTVVEGQLKNAQDNIKRILKEIQDFNKT